MNLDNAVKLSIPLIVGEEGVRTNAYWDVNGYAIGYGNHYYKNGSAVKQGDTISKSDAYDLMAFYVRQFANDILPGIKVEISDYNMAALISLAYNCGEGVRNSTLFTLINNHASEQEIEAQYKKTCVTSKGVYNPTLAQRRINELKVFAMDVQNLIDKNRWAVPVTGFLVFGTIGYILWKVARKN